MSICTREMARSTHRSLCIAHFPAPNLQGAPGGHSLHEMLRRLAAGTGVATQSAFAVFS